MPDEDCSDKAMAALVKIMEATEFDKTHMAFAVFRGARGYHVVLILDPTKYLFSHDLHFVGIKGGKKE